MERYEKLVRDNMPDILDQKGVPYERIDASPERYKEELIKKLLEEVTEFLKSGGDIEELADTVEVIEALKQIPEYQDVESVRLKKREERGGFDKRIILKGEK